MSLAPLHDFFVDSFDTNEGLLIFLDGVAPDIKASLPNVSVARETYAFRALEILRARAYLDQALFQALLDALPRRGTRVVELAASYIGEAAAKQLRLPTVPPPRNSGVIMPTEKVRILLLAADPTDKVQAGLGREEQTVKDALAGLRASRRVRIDTYWSVSAGLLARTLTQHDPHVIHYAGHGGSHGELLLNDADTDTAQPASADALLRMFRQLGGLKCVVLNACYSTRLAQGLALDLPLVVVGMRSAVDDHSSRVFAEHFYREIAAGKSLQLAFDTARNVLEAANLPGEDLPQLNAHPSIDADDVVLFPLDPGPGTPGPARREPSPALVQEFTALLLSLFSSDEFLRFLRFGQTTASVVPLLPAGPVAPVKLVSDAVDVLLRQGLVDDAFFVRLLAERPRRADEIRGLQAKLRPAS